MNIAIDYTAAARQGAGIGRYARELVYAILAAGSPHRYVLMAAVAGLGEHWTREQQHVRDIAVDATALRFRTLPLTDDWMARLWQRARLPLPAEWITGRVDTFYSPDFVLPPLQRRTRAILTVHDLSFLRHPETFPPKLGAYLKQAVPRSVARADLILADSEATRSDLIELLHVPHARVTTLYSGVSPRFSPCAADAERARLQTQYGVGARPYILSVGTVQPRKNYIRLMEACDALAAQRDLDLVIVGRPAWLAEPIVAAAEQRPYVHLLGFCDDADLPALYRQAALLAFPSVYEGFGFPPLEAMACGTPVVASTASSVPEVVGAAGLLLDPLDIPAWTAALTRILDDLPLREHLRQAGLARAAQFTWANAAQQWLSVVESL
ncbi:MAG TPA: glycosyltransferase family 1 protein [Anaerolineae bacterium]|nr:glycosyltransferase family 1 protein [Anaerolineae bacterium]HQI83722.1 glycosyltransferase family 1 protein [Anaerolineae bacterium]